jgi:hypothetical protein
MSEREARRRKLAAEAIRSELEVAVQRGELVALGPLNAWMAGCILRAQEILLRIGPELRDRLAHESNPNRCEQLVTVEVERALRQLSEYKIESVEGKTK